MSFYPYPHIRWRFKYDRPKLPGSVSTLQISAKTIKDGCDAVNVQRNLSPIIPPSLCLLFLGSQGDQARGFSAFAPRGLSLSGFFLVIFITCPFLGGGFFRSLFFCLVPSLFYLLALHLLWGSSAAALAVFILYFLLGVFASCWPIFGIVYVCISLFFLCVCASVCICLSLSPKHAHAHTDRRFGESCAQGVFGGKGHNLNRPQVSQRNNYKRCRACGCVGVWVCACVCVN